MTDSTPPPPPSAHTRVTTTHHRLPRNINRWVNFVRNKFTNKAYLAALALIVITGLIVTTTYPLNHTDDITHVQHSYMNQPEPDIVTDLTSISDTDAVDSLRAMAKLLDNSHPKSDMDSRICPVKYYGKGYGKHPLCEMTDIDDCKMITFGVEKEYSFEMDLANNIKCKGVALDPTVNHRAHLHDNILFMAIGANSPQQVNSKGAAMSGWQTTTVPDLLTFLKYDRVTVLKMDCEGCEYSLADDVIGSDRHMFERIDQFTVEFHMTKFWIPSTAELHALGRLVYLLGEAGLQLASYELTACAGVHEKMKCIDELHEIGWPCGRHNSCQNFLFASRR